MPARRPHPSSAGDRVRRLVIVPYELTFSQRYRYDSRLEGITIPVVLRAGAETIDLLAKIDSGASDCLFERDYAEALSLPIEDGVRKTFTTANSRFEAYGHELSIAVLSIEVTSIVYFFADPGITRNVLGRRGWLDRICFGLVDYDRTAYLDAYDR